jgi:pimeloyl-ACP methyl ester carboxylesterase
VGRVLSEDRRDDGLETELMIGHLPATLLRPVGDGPFPTVLYCHAHGGKYDLGRRELTEGAPWMSAPAGSDLLHAGYAVLCVDMPGFGDRQSEGTESALSKAALWHGQPLFGRMIQDLMAALSWLRAQGFVDTSRIATFGASMGAAHSYWLAALDPEICAAAHLIVLADIEPLIACGAHDRHGHFLTVPGLLNLAESGDIAALIAPRPQFVGHGGTDALTPETARLAALEKLRTAYGSLNTLETFFARESGHVETPEMRTAALAFLARAFA